MGDCLSSDQSRQHKETPSLQKFKKETSWAWWHAPVVPTIREVEAGELFEPGRLRLQGVVILPLHSSLEDRGKPCLKRKKKKKKKVWYFKRILINLFRIYRKAARIVQNSCTPIAQLILLT